MREGQKTVTARRPRKTETLAEKRLWEQLRNRQLEDFKFVGQAPVGPYVVDFLCRETGLVIEADGATHSTGSELAYDASRPRDLEARGLSIGHFQNDEIINGIDEVLTLIVNALTHGPSPSPSLRDGSLSSPASGRGSKDIIQ